MRFTYTFSGSRTAAAANVMCGRVLPSYRRLASLSLSLDTHGKNSYLLTHGEDEELHVAIP